MKKRGIKNTVMQRILANRSRYTDAPLRDLLEQQAIRALQEPAALAQCSVPQAGERPSTVPFYIENRHGKKVINTHKTPVFEL